MKWREAAISRSGFPVPPQERPLKARREVTPIRLSVYYPREGSKPNGRNRPLAGSVYESPAPKVRHNLNSALPLSMARVEVTLRKVHRFGPCDA